VEKMQFTFFVPPNEELDGTLHPQKIGCTSKNEGKRVHVRTYMYLLPLKAWKKFFGDREGERRKILPS
jgi:hypothetical protein